MPCIFANLRFSGNRMERRKISAREAVADIRSGMDDSALMTKYGLSAEGLQTLFDKLVNTGFIDLAEIRPRLMGYVGTVVLPELDLLTKKDRGKEKPPKGKAERRINAQEAARDIRLGMDKSALAEKYRLTPKGVTSLLNKLLSLGLLSEKDLFRMRADIEDHSVDLREIQPDLSDAFKTLGFGSAAPSPARLEPKFGQSTVKPVAKSTIKKEIAGTKQNADREPQKKGRGLGSLEEGWYDKPIILTILLISPLFPLGFYGLYRTRRISSPIKAFIILGWFALAAVVILTFGGHI